MTESKDKTFGGVNQTYISAKGKRILPTDRNRYGLFNDQINKFEEIYSDLNLEEAELHFMFYSVNDNERTEEIPLLP
ncbi:Uncharacterised protein [Chlamydia abortus]|nr:Uncharacterised protein [Chlamydia abortus]